MQENGRFSLLIPLLGFFEGEGTDAMDQTRAYVKNISFGKVFEILAFTDTLCFTSSDFIFL